LVKGSKDERCGFDVLTSLPDVCKGTSHHHRPAASDRPADQDRSRLRARTASNKGGARVSRLLREMEQRVGAGSPTCIEKTTQAERGAKPRALVDEGSDRIESDDSRIGEERVAGHTTEQRRGQKRCTWGVLPNSSPNGASRRGAPANPAA
jgi:hypothetical protein